MCFDVPKVVRSPGYDHGHDEESRNGRDVKIDILDEYVRTPKVSREVFDIYGSTGGYRNPPGSILGLLGLSWRRGGAARAGCAPPPPLVRVGQGGGRRPPFLPPLSPFLPPLLLGQRKEGVLLPVGVGLPLARPLLGRPPPPPLLLYIRGQGDTSRHNNN